MEDFDYKVLVYYDDGEIEENVFCQDFEADACFAELNEWSVDELQNAGIRGFVQLEKDEDEIYQIRDEYFID